jgi:TolB-like protein/DNA-binding winged helix-turn-helix (wHTH) protein/Flp pilus assembly protein TadD
VSSKPIKAQETIKFGQDFELDLNAYELRHSGRALRLERIPMEVLLFLIERGDQLVSREQIVERIWGNSVFLDTDNSINGAIRKIRQALKDDPERPRFIQTVTGRGYRFIAPIIGDRRAGTAGSQEVANVARTDGSAGPRLFLATEPAGEHPSRKRTRARAAVALALLIPVAIGVAIWATTSSHRTNAGLTVRSIAVLPLDNLSGDPSQDYFVDGMTDELITDLAKVSALRVISRTSVMRYKGTHKGLPEIARELNVDGIVEGSVVRSGKRVRITAQLLYAPSDQHLWAETYERDVGDVLRLQSEVAQVIAEQVRAQVTPQQQARLRSARPVNAEAYEAYLKGRYYLSNQFTLAGPLNTARSSFEESIQKDPGFALAYSGLADSYVFLAFFRQMSSDRAYESAKEALRKALELDDSIGEAHDTLGLLSWRFEWNWDAAGREFDQAIALSPGYSCAHEDRAQYLAFIGRRNDALAEIAKISEMDPGPSSAMTIAGVYYQLRDYQALVEAGQRGVIANPNEWVEHFNLGMGYAGTGKRLEAVFEYQKAVEMSNGDLDAAAALAHSYAMIGRRAEAEKILHDLERKAKGTYVSPYVIATVYAGLGEKDRAFEFLEKAYQKRDLEMNWHLKADVRLDSLRSDPRFQNLLHRAGFDRLDGPRKAS